MTFEEADELIDNFVDKYNIQNVNGVDFTVYPITELPCSSGKLKYAHFLFAEYMIGEGEFTKSLGDMLVKSYAYLARFLDEDDGKVSEINKENLTFLKKLNEGGLYSSLILNEVNSLILQNTIEFNNFLADCQNNYLTK